MNKPTNLGVPVGLQTSHTNMRHHKDCTKNTRRLDYKALKQAQT
jgi:hypothetical protein